MKKEYSLEGVKAIKRMVVIAIIFVLCFTVISISTQEVSAASHKHSYKVTGYNKTGWLEHNKVSKCNCGKIKKVKESCSDYKMKQVGKVRDWTYLGTTKTEKKYLHAHRMQCPKCKHTYGMACTSKKCGFKK